MAKPSPKWVISHWNKFFEGYQTPAKEFYSAVEEALKRREVPDTSNSRVDWREGAIFSAKREYLRIKRRGLVFDICAAPFGNGFFFSWWLCQPPSGFWLLMSFIPIFGPLMIWAFKRETYFQMDTAMMFQGAVHAAVLEVIDGLTSAKGIRGLSELERKPILGRM